MKLFLRSLFIFGCCFSLFLKGNAQDIKLSGPDKKLVVTIIAIDGNIFYDVMYNNKMMLQHSPLGLKTNEGDFSAGMKYIGKEDSVIDKTYTQDKIKKSQVH